MGCLPGKIPGCLEPFPDDEEEVEALINIQESYKEILTPYKIKDSLTPTLILAQVKLTPSVISYEELRNKDLSVFSYTINQLVSGAAEIFSQFNLNKMKFHGFLELIRKNYYTNVPFHNFRHCFSVLHSIFVIAERNKGLEGFIGYQDYLYLLLSALGHDVCHPGVGNAYLVSSKHDLALQYNDRSVLENHHAAVTLMMIRFSGILPDVDFTYLKEVISSTILSTDFAQHKEVLSSFQRIKVHYNKSKKSSRLSFMNYLLHCADLSHEALDFSQSSIWSLKLIQELNQQAACEELLCVTLSNTLKLGKNMKNIKKHQNLLLTNTVLPLYSNLCELVNDCKDYEDSIKDNIIKWESLEDFNI